MSDHQVAGSRAPAPELSSAGTTGAALQLRGIRKTFDGVTVLRGVDVSIAPGRVHALLGGNGSGKSTTLKIVAGVYTGDPGGSITVAGEEHPTESFTPVQAHRAGLRFVHQDLGLVEGLTIAENFALVSGFPRALGAVRWRELHRRTERELVAAGIRLDPRTPVQALRPSDRTLVAIARALQAEESASGPLVLVLDEPTASLPHHEVDALLDELRRRRAEGHAVVYVSHRIPEVLAVADDLTVLRDGQVAYSGPIDGLTEESIIELMTGTTGRLPDLAVSAPSTSSGQPILSVTGLECPGLGPLDVELRAGEVVGVAGLLGSGRSRLLRLLSGQQPRTAGTVLLDGAAVSHRSPAAALADGVAYVPEDRARDAAFADRPLWENISAATFPRYARSWGMARRAEQRDAVAVGSRFAVRAAHGGVAFSSLSGGNQQKAVLARTAWTGPRVLLLDEPSQGVDAMARREIHELVRRHVGEERRAALVVSSDFVELASLCDRVLVLRGGVLQGQLSGTDLTEDSIAQAVHRDKEDTR